MPPIEMFLHSPSMTSIESSNWSLIGRPTGARVALRRCDPSWIEVVIASWSPRWSIVAQTMLDVPFARDQRHPYDKNSPWTLRFPATTNGC